MDGCLHSRHCLNFLDATRLLIELENGLGGGVVDVEGLRGFLDNETLLLHEEQEHAPLFGVDLAVGQSLASFLNKVRSY